MPDITPVSGDGPMFRRRFGPPHITTNRPDIAVLDLNLPDLFTLAIVRKLREAQVVNPHRGSLDA